jgi:hypothetical protein
MEERKIKAIMRIPSLRYSAQFQHVLYIVTAMAQVGHENGTALVLVQHLGPLALICSSVDCSVL